MRLAVVVPCYNEEASVSELVLSLLPQLGPDDFVLFVDDGSTDASVACLLHFPVRVLRLANNYGHQTAILKGLLQVKGKCDAAITMDADGQHDPSYILSFVLKYKAGADIVYGVRRRNPSLASRLFYRLMGDSLVPNHGDFRLISSRVLDTLTEDSEPFLRGLFADKKWKSAIIEYDEQPRIAGRSTYTVRKRIVLFASALRWRFSR